MRISMNSSSSLTCVALALRTTHNADNRGWRLLRHTSYVFVVHAPDCIRSKIRCQQRPASISQPSRKQIAHSGRRRRRRRRRFSCFSRSFEKVSCCCCVAHLFGRRSVWLVSAARLMLLTDAAFHCARNCPRHLRYFVGATNTNTQIHSGDHHRI